MRRASALVALLLLAGVTTASANIQPGQSAPDFTKNALSGPPWAKGGPVSLGDYTGKVVILFLLGYS